MYKWVQGRIPVIKMIISGSCDVISGQWEAFSFRLSPASIVHNFHGCTISHETAHLFGMFHYFVHLIKVIHSFPSSCFSPTESVCNQSLAVADLRGAPGTPPGGPNSIIFMQFGRKNRLAHPLWELAPPPTRGKSWIHHCSGKSRIFPSGMRQLPNLDYFAICLPKTAGKWKNLDPGGACPWRSPP